MKFRILSIFFLAIFSIADAQTQRIENATGEFIFREYANNIIKITWQPKRYQTNENVSDAVILKQLQSQSYKKLSKVRYHESIFFKNTRIDFEDGKIHFTGNKNIVVHSVFQNEGFSGFRFKLEPGEKIFGGGERAIPLNRRGYKFPLYNNPWYGYSEGADALNFSVPFFTSSNGYGLFFDNASKGYADIGKSSSDIFEAGFMSGELNVYIIPGKDYKEILALYHKLTGTQPLPPRWAMGNLMSRFGYSSEKQVTDILRKMQVQKFPVDAIIFDLFWFGDSIKGTLGNLDWVNKTNWPDPKKMITNFSRQNINTILIAEPFILKGTRTYKAAKEYFSTDSLGNPYELTDFYFGIGGLLDIYRKDAGGWIWKDHYERQLANGVSGWWTDLGEPEKHPSDMFHNMEGLGFKRRMKADEVHNVYGHYWNKMLFTNYAKELPDKRLFHLNRSGFGGSQRYSIFPWSGDISRSWSGLRAQLPVMLGMSMSGIPYIHADAGGFAGGEGDNELYVRWLQFAAFTPIFRPHGTALYGIDKTAFSFPSEPALIEEPYRGYAKAVVNLRYALLPYNYTLAYRQALNGAPLVAPLYYHYPNDTTAVNVEDEFMWGENILVAPVLQKGSAERKIYLPQGNWYALNNFNNDLTDTSIYQSVVNYPASVGNVPVFVKAGSFIPTIIKPDGANTKAFTTDSLTVHYYFSRQPSNYAMYDDDGNNRQSMRLKQFELINFRAEPLGQKLRFIISSNGGNFAGKPVKRNIKLIIHGIPAVPQQVYINGTRSTRPLTVKSTGGVPNGSYYLNVGFSAEPVNIEIK